MINERLTDPERLRPRRTFDLFTTALVNHLVGFIVLSLVAGAVVTAFDRALFGRLFDGLFRTLGL